MDVFHHHDGAVDDDSEIDSPNGKKVCRNTAGVQENKRKEQTQRNGQSDDNRRAHADQEKNQNNQDQAHAEQHVVLHRVDGQLHQVAAVIVGTDFHVLRQQIAVDLLGLLLHSFENVLRLLAGEHEDDTFHPVIVVLKPEFAQARSVADGDLANVADA